MARFWLLAANGVGIAIVVLLLIWISEGLW